MEAYTAFAKVYDRFMENVPYDKWGDFIEFVVDKYGISKPSRDSVDALESERNLVLDMGCGTGVLTEIMYNKGYDMIGVDISQEMLDVALRRKLAKYVNDTDTEDIASEAGILYLCQDMCELDLYSTIGTVYSTCDSINYLIEDEEVEACFDRVSNYLYPEGLFIFDVNTVHKYRDVIGDVTIAENAEECSFIWDNFYSEEDNVNEYDLTLFIESEDADSCGRKLYEKYSETHYQRGFEVEEIIKMLSDAGLELMAIIDESIVNDDKCSYKSLLEVSKMGKDKEAVNLGVNEESERVIFIARKPIK